MGRSFLLRYQEQQVRPGNPEAHLLLATGTKVPGEQPDRAAYAAYETRSDPRRDMETSTAVSSERPDNSAAGESCGALPTRAATANTLTTTEVDSEAPKKDDVENHSALVLPVAETGTKTAIPGEQPDRSAAGESCAALPEKAAPEIVNSTLTYTYVHAEAPRKDERRRSALVLPACS